MDKEKVDIIQKPEITTPTSICWGGTEPFNSNRFDKFDPCTFKEVFNPLWSYLKREFIPPLKYNDGNICV